MTSKKRYRFLRLLNKLIFLILLLPGVCFAAVNTDSVLSIGTTPDGDAVSGSLIESVTFSGGYLTIFNGEMAVPKKYEILLSGSYLDLHTGTMGLSRITDSTFAIGTAPDGDAVDGFFTGSLSLQGMVVEIHNGTMGLSKQSEIVFNGSSIDIYTGTMGLSRITDSTFAIGTAPDGDAVDGFFTGSLSLQGMVVEIHNGTMGLSKQSEIVFNGSSIDIYTGTMGLSRITDSVSPIGAIPDGDSVDGAFVGAITMVGNTVNLATGEMELIPTWLEGQGSYLLIITGNIGSAKLSPGADLSAGAYIYNDQLTKLYDIEDAGMIVFEGF